MYLQIESLIVRTDWHFTLCIKDFPVLNTRHVQQMDNMKHYQHFLNEAVHKNFGEQLPTLECAASVYGVRHTRQK